MPRIEAIDHLLLNMPLWLLGILLSIAGILAVEAGAWWSKNQLRKGKITERTAGLDTQSFMIGSVFGLLALLISLTFSLALDRYDERRVLVASEANAISTAYLRAGLFDEPSRSELRSSLRNYAASRIVPDNLPIAEQDRLKQQSAVLGQRIWELTHKAVLPYRESELASYFVEAVNNMLDVGTFRMLAGKAHVPGAIIDALFLYLLVSAAMLGSLLVKDGVKQRYASSLLIILFVLGIVLIIDIDRPRAGSIVVSQQGLEDLVGEMDRSAGVSQLQKR